jgi:molybdate transport system substrate-binding protein
MIMPSHLRRIVIAAFAALLIGASNNCAFAAEIKVMSDIPIAPALSVIGGAFQQETGNQVKLVFDTSSAIERRIKNDEPADVLILQPVAVGDLIKADKVPVGRYLNIARVGLGLFTRAELTTPQVTTIELFKAALTDADMIVFSDGMDGDYFSTVLDRLGIADEVVKKLVRVPAKEVTTRVMEAKGNDVGMAAKTLIAAEKRVKLLSELPRQYQTFLLYCAAPVKRSHVLPIANQFIEYLASSPAQKEFVAIGAY